MRMEDFLMNLLLIISYISI